MKKSKKTHYLKSTPRNRMPMPFFFLEPVFLQPSDRPKINHFNVWKYAAQVVQNYLLINNIYFPKKKIEKLGSK